MNPQALPPKPPVSLAPAPAPAPPGITSTVNENDLLQPMDIGKLRSRIYEHAFEAVKSLPPVQNSRYKLALENPRWVDPENVSPSAQKKAFFQGGSLSRRIAGDWVLTDVNTNTPVSRKTATVAAVPHLSDRGLFLLNGSHWHLGAQTRLDPGVYPRRQENGEISAYVNPKGGRPHHISLDPAKGLFYFELGSSRLPLIPILQTLGATPDQMREAWGHDVLARNSEKSDTSAVAKLFKKLYEDRKPTVGSDERKMVAEKLQSWGLDPYVTERTLGKGHSNYTAETLLETTKRLLAISRKEADPVERDDQAFQHILGQEHLFAERIRNSKPLLNQLLWKMTAKGNLDNLPSGALNQHLVETITGTGLGINAQMTNPAEMLDAVYRVSKMGKGGISDIAAVPDECYDEQTEVLTKEGWKFWREVSLDTELACQTGGALMFSKPYQLYRKEYDGELYGVKTRTIDYLVTPNHRVWCRKYRGFSGTKRCGQAPWVFELAKVTHRKPREFSIACAPYPGSSTKKKITLPGSFRTASVKVNFIDWAEFVGWYAAEGHIPKKSKKGTRAIYISQNAATNAPKCRRIEALLGRLGFSWSYQGHNFVIYARGACEILAEQVGLGSKNKSLPSGFLEWPAEVRQRMLEALVAGDGTVAKNGLITFLSTSKRLRDDFMLLACSLGLPVKERKAYQPKNLKHNKAYYCAVLTSKVQGVTSEKMYDKSYYITHYKGTIYCATVPGGLLLVRRNRSVGVWSGNSRDVHGTQFGFIDPAVTPESGKIGVDLRFGSGTARGKDGRIYSKFHDISGKPLWLSPREVRGKIIAAWEQKDNGEPFVEAMKDGKFSLVPRKEVNLWTQPSEYAFSPVANLIPFKSASPIHRTAMGTRMTTQALPLIGGESPLVASGHPDGGSFESKYGVHFGAVRAQQPGRVMSVSPDAIKVKYQDGTTGDINLRVHELYDHAPGRKTHFTQRPAVKPGDFFDKDHLLATSNYTDNAGRVALGLNARVAWLPARGGKSFEDAFAVSQSFADRMKSDHMAVHGVEEAGVEFGKNKFKSLFASKYDPKVFENLDDNGVIKPGTKVQPGQPLILAVKKLDAPRTTLVRSPKPIHQDASEVWDHDYPGEVVDVVKTKGGYRVSVKSEVPMQFGDKISGRHGNKGIITIIPDHEMPVGEDGKPFEVIASPYTLSSRKNDSQIAEVVLSKIARKLGKPYEVPDFKLPDLMQFVREEANKHGVSPTETVFDPVTGTKIPGVLAGSQYFMKLQHVVEGKIKHRDVGGYDAFDTPAKGGSTGAKRMALADSFALIAHGANSFLQGSKNVRGQRNENWWEATMSGYTPAMPGENMQYQRFMSGLQAVGVHPVQENGKIRLKALTDDQIQHFAGDRELQNAKGLDWSKEGDPFPGGLFDRKIFGENFNLWGKMKLHKPMPNPAFEDPIRYTLGLTEKQMRQVIAGKAGFVEGKFFDPEKTEDQKIPRGFTTGPEAIQAKLKNIDLDKEIAAAHAAIAGTRKTHRDTAIRKLKYLQGAKDQGVHPSQWMWSNVPILPPRFRPVSRLQGSNTELVSDPNYLYQDLFNANKNLKQLDGQLEDLSDEHLALYDSLKAVAGLGDPINPKTEQKGVKGLLRLLLAESPKWSIPQHKLLSSPVDLVGRSTIAPDSSLDMDEIGIPEDMAFTTYSRFAIQRLVKSGMSPVEATRAIENKSQEARQAVLKEMEIRPVSYHRAPVLHQFGHIGAWPKLIKGNVIKLSPFVYKGLGGDNDGDTVNIHVPVYDKEIDDITQKMMPSKNLLSVKDFAPHYKPEREFHVGLWQATAADPENKATRKRVFHSISDLKAAFQKGEVSVKDKVVLLKDE